jgi:hypothetical protein
MKRRKPKQISIDDIQFYVARCVDLHPLLYNQFLEEIINLENKNKICAMPITILEHYHIRLANKHKKVA